MPGVITVRLICAFPKGAAVVTAHLRGEPITGVPWYKRCTSFTRDCGTRHCWRTTRRERTVLLRFADWAVAATAPLSDAQFETMLETEHGGMSEIFADMYDMTGKAEYRDLAAGSRKRRC